MFSHEVYRFQTIVKQSKISSCVRGVRRSTMLRWHFSWEGSLCARSVALVTKIFTANQRRELYVFASNLLLDLYRMTFLRSAMSEKYIQSTTNWYRRRRNLLRFDANMKKTCSLLSAERSQQRRELPCCSKRT